MEDCYLSYLVLESSFNRSSYLQSQGYYLDECLACALNEVFTLEHIKI